MTWKAAARTAVYILVALAAIAPGVFIARPAGADEGWVIRSFDVMYDIQETGAVLVTEDIRVDFGFLQKHGIYRDIPVEYAYDSENNRLTTITTVTVDDGAAPHRFELIGGSPNLRIKIGDPDVVVTGEQRYRIQYTVSGGLNPFPDHDEFYWNATGNEWPVTIEAASATVRLPAAAIERITCYEGPIGSTLTCDSSGDAQQAEFAATGPLGPGSGLTVVAGIKKGAVQVPPPVLVPAADEPWEDAGEFLGLNPVPVTLAVAVGVLSLALVIRQWWVAGRDRWFGDTYYFEVQPRPWIRPLFADETVVVEYQPPEAERRGRRLRPAEIGLLLDERADTLDVSATIVDLAVRDHLVIKETESGGILGLFKSRDYELENLLKPDGELLPYERRLMKALFNGDVTVKLSDLKNKFYKDLAKVKDDLYDASVKESKFFPQNPETVRLTYRIAGGVVAGVGATSIWLLGTVAGAGIVGVPVGAAGALLFAIAHVMPRRTAEGRLMYRRCLGFRKYMVTGETERQKFAENANLFDEYLPYAIVYGCVDKWAKAFEGLAAEGREPHWYVGPRRFMPSVFADSVSDFSSSISSVMASTPGGSGSSGFGGGSSGGGGGGGGGGSW